MPGLAATCCTQAGHSTLVLALMSDVPPVARNVVTHMLPPLVSLLPITLMGAAGSLRARGAAALGPHAGAPPLLGSGRAWCLREEHSGRRASRLRALTRTCCVAEAGRLSETSPQCDCSGSSDQAAQHPRGASGGASPPSPPARARGRAGRGVRGARVQCGDGGVVPRGDRAAVHARQRRRVQLQPLCEACGARAPASAPAPEARRACSAARTAVQRRATGPGRGDQAAALRSADVPGDGCAPAAAFAGRPPPAGAPAQRSAQLSRPARDALRAGRRARRHACAAAGPALAPVRLKVP